MPATYHILPGESCEIDLQARVRIEPEGEAVIPFFKLWHEELQLNKTPQGCDDFHLSFTVTNTSRETVTLHRFQTVFAMTLVLTAEPRINFVDRSHQQKQH